MKLFFPVALIFCFLLYGFSGCDKNCSDSLSCNEITLDKPFNAKLGEQWCLEGAHWNITFGPFIEDSRCNVPGIDCIWAGRYVMEAMIINGDSEERDTFFAVKNWSDTLYQGDYSIILSKVFPETHFSLDLLHPSKYSFDVIVKEQ